MHPSTRFLTIGLALLLISPILSAPLTSRADDGPSILRPNESHPQEFRFPITHIDPTAATNPKGANAPGYRGENQLIIYTPAFGASSQTNEAGKEAVVNSGVITHTASGNQTIPENGFVISAHGTAAQWLARFGKPGALAAIDTERQALIIRPTPAVYLHDVDIALRRAESRVENLPAEKHPAAHAYLNQARQCRAQLQQQAETGVVTRELTTLAETCEQEANRAFYSTVTPRAGEFRGAWIRPENLNPALIQKRIDSLKRAHVDHIFLETYYQGRTIYPSEVMKAYGLPEQHNQFRGGDPLQLWIDAAHQNGLKVHVWAQVFFAGNARENPETFGPILQKYPDWRNVQRPHWNKPNPEPSDVEPGHYFLDPAHPEVRAFLEKLLLEMVSRYEIDGLNLDYIRYPASATVNKPWYLGSTWGYTETARRQFMAMLVQERNNAIQKQIDAFKKAGKAVPHTLKLVAPDPATDPKNLTTTSPLWPRWVSWRKEQVSSFVKNISQKSRALRPNLQVSAVVFPSSDPTYAQKLQDYPRWAKEGDIQALTPIGLSPRPDLMRKQCQQLSAQVPIPVYVGIFALYNRNTPVELLEQIEALQQTNMAGIVLFDWARMNDAYEEALRLGPFRE